MEIELDQPHFLSGNAVLGTVRLRTAVPLPACAVTLTLLGRCDVTAGDRTIRAGAVLWGRQDGDYDRVRDDDGVLDPDVHYTWRFCVPLPADAPPSVAAHEYLHLGNGQRRKLVANVAYTLTARVEPAWVTGVEVRAPVRCVGPPIDPSDRYHHEMPRTIVVNKDQSMFLFFSHGAIRAHVELDRRLLIPGTPHPISATLTLENGTPKPINTSNDVNRISVELERTIKVYPEAQTQKIVTSIVLKRHPPIELAPRESATVTFLIDVPLDLVPTYKSREFSVSYVLKARAHDVRFAYIPVLVGYDPELPSYPPSNRTIGYGHPAAPAAAEGGDFARPVSPPPPYSTTPR